MEDKLEEQSPDLQSLLEKKYKVVYSERLDRDVYTLVDWVDKSVFKRYKKLFGYTDIGWTVKHPKKLARALLTDGIWNLSTSEE